MTGVRVQARASAATIMAILATGLSAAPGVSAVPSKAGYAGSDKCGSCHQIQYKGWVKTFHSTVIQDARKTPPAILGDMNAPGLPFKRADIHFTIGGHWDQRYLTRIGDDYYVLPRLWSVQSRKWRPYSEYGWQRRPYSRYCIGCHSIGFDPKTKEVAEYAIGCESCHGPGSQHGEKPGKANIVNPKRLPKDRADEICASCHVRGKDPSGEYLFPIGWKPGEDLANSLVPLDLDAGESSHDAIHRLWDKWRTEREAKARTRCEVCGIPSSGKPKVKQVSPDATCKGCHAFEENLEKHTHHAADTAISCMDCHVQKDPEEKENKEDNIHSYGYFLIHPQGCWDKDIHKRCGSCHTGRPEEWAREIVSGWEEPVVMDH